MSRIKGSRFERIALDYLKGKGLIYLSRNYYACGGEIDLIMHHDNQIVFIEVKGRRNTRYGWGLEFVDKRKQVSLVKAAYHFIMRQPHSHRIEARFDVISIDGGNIEWIQNAFENPFSE